MFVCVAWAAVVVEICCGNVIVAKSVMTGNVVVCVKDVVVKISSNWLVLVTTTIGVVTVSVAIVVVLVNVVVAWSAKADDKKQAKTAKKILVETILSVKKEIGNGEAKLKQRKGGKGCDEGKEILNEASLWPL